MVVHGHALFKRREGFKVFTLRIEFPVVCGTAVIADNRMPEADTAPVIQELHFALFLYVTRIDTLHKLQNIFLPVFMTRQRRSYVNYLTQNDSG